MKSKLIILWICVILVGFSTAEFRTIALDASFSDWASVTAITEPADDASYWVDIVDFRVCNDGQNLYFYVRFDDVHVGTAQHPSLQFGGESKVHYIDILVDSDNNASTGTLMGKDASNQVGADYTVTAGRRQPVASPTRYGSYLFQGAHISSAGISSPKGIPTAFSDNAGIADATVTTGVYAIEERMPLDLSPYGGPNLTAGDTISFVVVGSRSDKTTLGDWLNVKVTYTIVTPAVECGDWGYAPGDINKDCYVDIEDFAIMASEWMQ